MIKVVAKMMVQIGRQADFKALAGELVKESAAESGNVFYTLNVSRMNPRQYVFIECWRDQAALDHHNISRHFTGIFPKLRALCSGDVTVELFDEI